MMNILEFPVELLEAVVAFVDPGTQKTLLQLCRILYGVTLPFVLARLNLNTKCLSKWLSADTPRCLLHSHVRMIALNVTGSQAELTFDNIERLQKERHDLTDSELNKMWESCLDYRFIRFCGDIPMFSRLSKLEISITCTSQHYFCGWTQSSKPFVNHNAILKLLEALPTCENLTSLLLDTTDAETTSWQPVTPAGIETIGERCADHVCPLIARGIAALPKLREVRIRRRDICPAVFGFVHAKQHLENHHSTIPISKLETIIINTRLADCQRTGMGTWGAEARYCNSACTCQPCNPFESALDLTIVDRLSNAGKLTALAMPSIKSIKVLGYGKPDLTMQNTRRRPNVTDCLTGSCRIIQRSWLGGWEDEVEEEGSQIGVQRISYLIIRCPVT